jgi:hypothetical protein
MPGLRRNAEEIRAVDVLNYWQTAINEGCVVAGAPAVEEATRIRDRLLEELAAMGSTLTTLSTLPKHFGVTAQRMVCGSTVCGKQSEALLVLFIWPTAYSLGSSTTH